MQSFQSDVAQYEQLIRGIGQSLIGVGIIFVVSLVCVALCIFGIVRQMMLVKTGRVKTGKVIHKVVILGIYIITWVGINILSVMRFVLLLQ